MKILIINDSNLMSFIDSNDLGFALLDSDNRFTGIQYFDNMIELDNYSNIVYGSDNTSFIGFDSISNRIKIQNNQETNNPQPNDVIIRQDLDKYSTIVPTTISNVGNGGTIESDNIGVLQTTGQYLSQSYRNNYSDIPSGENGSFYVNVISYDTTGTGGVVNQYLYPRDNYSAFYVRTFNNGRWSSWKKFLSV